MANKRCVKKRNKKATVVQAGEICDRLMEQMVMLNGIADKIEKQDEVIRFFYEEYQELKRRNEKRFLMACIRMREAFKKEIFQLSNKEPVNWDAIEVIKVHLDECTAFLEENGVEITVCGLNEVFNKEMERPISRDDVDDPELNNRITRIYSDGYNWHGGMLKKIEVAVGVYKNSTER